MWMYISLVVCLWIFGGHIYVMVIYICCVVDVYMWLYIYNICSGLNFE